MAEQGCAVSIWGRNAEKNAAAEARLRAHSDKVQSIVCDVAVRDQTERAAEATLKQFGRIDGCFANAGIGGGGRTPFAERSEDDWRQNVFQSISTACFMRSSLIVRHMVERAAKGDGFGRLVATSSMASLFGTARNEHYAASKSAINSLIQALAVEHARYGMTANAILPGWIDTEMTEGLRANDKFMAAAVPRIPVRRFGQPKDFGGIAVYLMSQASAYHTGDCIVIDGGYSIS